MDEAAGPTRGPIFIVGSMRSGSTMLRLILDSHPDIAIGSESGFMGALSANKEIPNWQFGKGWYERFGWTEPEIDARLRDFYAGIFGRFAERQGKRRWGEKTPFHTSHIPQMAQVFPDSLFVGIVRHPAAVAASLRRNFHYTLEDAVSYWRGTNLELIRSGAALAGRFCLLRYEDLVVDHEPLLKELLGFLDEPWHPDVLEHHRVQRDKGASRAAEGGTSTRDPVDAARAGRWADDATPGDRLAVQPVRPLAEFLGYDLDDPERRERLNEQGPEELIVTGAALATRCRAWRHRVDFYERPVSVLVEASPEQLAQRLARAEAALARTRNRRVVRWADAARRVQRGRSVADLKVAWALARGPRSTSMEHR